MFSTVAQRSARSGPHVLDRPPAGWHGSVIDCDVHAQVPSLDALRPYLAEHWQEFVDVGGFAEPNGVGTVFPPRAPSSVRDEWRPADGAVAASSLALVREHCLDATPAIESAIVACYYATDSVRHPDLQAALVRAVNDWLLAEWIGRDERLRMSMLVPVHTIADAVAEIERIGSHPRVVQALLPVRQERPYGTRNWHPVMRALTEQDLVLGLHWGGTSAGAPTATGWPSWYVEECAGEIQNYMAQLMSMVAEGVFQRFPSLRVTMLDGGFTWLPSLAWRMDKEWKGLRRAIPWVNEPPTTIIRRHLRFSTAPLDAGPPQQMQRILEWLGSDELLMFGSDHPHRHDDDFDAFLELVPEASRARLMSENARAWYRL